MLITVSNCNFKDLLSLKNGESVIVEHIGSRQRITLQKISTSIKPKKMTIADIEGILGYPIEIVEE